VHVHCAHYTVQCRNTVYTASAKIQVSLQSAIQKHSIHYQIRNTMYTSRYTAATQCTLYITMKCVMHTTLHNELCYCTTLGRDPELQYQVLESSPPPPPVVVPVSMAPSMPGDCSPLSHLHSVYMLWLLPVDLPLA